ncbi:hypothetical protein [Ligilactobacillus salivarius]|uniref:hypothetical protein n=1 Tax=Ligilactobacillus salivarius TaxID=1624 RepID=UPI0016521544|nr:hypothetical protein [Ligilactobacillus salivarius]MBC6925046.1 hypothetical protein [Ligilactobacillus salivarius]
MLEIIRNIRRKTGATIKHLHKFGIKSYCFDDFTAPTGTKQKYQEQPTATSEVSDRESKNILISLKNVDKLKIEISAIGYIIAFVALATQKTVMEILQ